jgi:SAM-dependent methyltransferase
MFNLSGYYHKLVPPFLKRLIDPDSFRIQQFVGSSIKQSDRNCLILDAGAGESRNRRFITDQKYIAMDAGCGDPSWDYSNLDVIADLEGIPFKTNSFGLVICTQVLEHVKEPLIVLKELWRVTKAGGALYISAPQGWGVHQAPFDYFRYTHFGLHHLLVRAGFTEISITPTCGYFSYLANRLTVFPKTLFWQIERRWLRIVVSPLEMLSYILFVFLLPMFLNSIDFLDRDQNYTLNYLARAIKPASHHEP